MTLFHRECVWILQLAQQPAKGTHNTQQSRLLPWYTPVRFPWLILLPSWLSLCSFDITPT